MRARQLRRNSERCCAIGNSSVRFGFVSGVSCDIKEFLIAHSAD
jgi:hypothetical protein